MTKKSLLGALAYQQDITVLEISLVGDRTLGPQSVSFCKS